MDRSGALWFVADDVTKGFEIKNSRQAVAPLDPDEKGIVTNDTLGGPTKLHIISEFCFYELVRKSRKAAANAFRNWVTRDVLPSIRKSGSYNGTAAQDIGGM